MVSASDISRRDFLVGTGRSGVAIAAVGGLSGLLAACADSESQADADSITIGHLFSQTGAVAAVGQATAVGVNLRIDEANAAGGIESLDGAQIAVSEADDQSKPEAASGEVAKLAEDGVQLIISSVGSPSMLQAGQEAERQQVPIVNGISVFDKITERGFANTFCTCGKAELYTRDFVTNTKTVLDDAGLEPQRVGVLYENEIQGPFYAEWMRQFFPELTGWDVTYLDYPLDTTDFGPLLTRLNADNVDVVVLASYAADGALILQGMRSMNYRPALTTGCMGGVLAQEFTKTAGEAADGFAGESYWVESLDLPGQQEFVDAYQEENTGPVDVFTALGYAAASAVVDALERAGSTDRAAVRDAMGATTLAPGDQGFVLPGGLEFDDTGANVAVEGVYYQIAGGDREAVLPKEFAVTEPRIRQPA